MGNAGHGVADGAGGELGSVSRPDKWVIRWHGVRRDGASNRLVILQYPIEARTERGAVQAMRDRMRAEGVEPDGVPEVLRGEKDPPE